MDSTRPCVKSATFLKLKSAKCRDIIITETKVAKSNPAGGGGKIKTKNGDITMTGGKSRNGPQVGGGGGRIREKRWGGELELGIFPFK